VIFQLWTSVVFYLNQYDSGDVVHRVYMLAEFFGAVVLASFYTDHWIAGDIAPQRGTALGVLLARSSTVAIRLWSYCHNPLARRFQLTQFITDLIVIASIVPVTFVDAGDVNPDWFFGAAAILETVVPQLLSWALVRPDDRVGFNIEHITERFALLGVIALGEVVLGSEFAAADITPHTTGRVTIVLLSSFFVVIICLSFHMIYYDVEMKHGVFETHAFRRHKLGGTLWVQLHGPLAGATVSLGSGATLAVQAAVEDRNMVTSARVLLCIAAGVILFLVTLMRVLHEPSRRTKASNKQIVPVTLFTGLICIVLPFFGDSLSPVGLLAIISMSYLFTAGYRLVGSLHRKELF
jgi:low temperature requirement protein LtrA